jgi:hypothetical protein
MSNGSVISVVRWVLGDGISMSTALSSLVAGLSEPLAQAVEGRKRSCRLVEKNIANSLACHLMFN